MFKCVNKGTRTTFPSSLNIPTLFNIIDVSTTYNSMTVEWTAPAQGTAVGYKVYDSANNFMGSIAWPATGMTVTDLDAEIELPAEYDRALRSNLTIETAPDYAQAVSQELMLTALESKANIKRLNKANRNDVMTLDIGLRKGNIGNIYNGYN